MSTLTGTNSADNLVGSSDNDVLIGGAGNDTLNGGAGTDTADYESSTSGVTVNLSTGTASDGLGGTDTLISIEQVGGSDFNDVLIGNALDNFILGRLGNDSIEGGDGDDQLVGGHGTDTLVGGAGNDLLAPGTGPGANEPKELLFGGDGFDSADYRDLPYGIAADLYSGTFNNTYDSIENLLGSNFDDTLRGDYRDNVLYGYDGADVFEGREGADLIDGGAGTDIAVYSGVFSNYTITANADGSFTVQDNRANHDGRDTIRNVEILRFADGDRAPSGGGSPGGGSVDATIAAAITNILRINGSSSSLGVTLTTQVQGGQLNMNQAIGEVVKAADATTAVAVLSYQFFTGKIPSQGGIDFLVSTSGPNPNNLNSAYYQSFNIENRFINFAVNLGKAGEGRAAFEQAYGAKDLFEATRSAYTTIFGGSPSDAKLHALLDPTLNLGGQTMTRAEYFAYYGQDGVNGIGAKAAMVGWLLAEAAKADLGVYARSSDQFLLDLQDGAASFAVDLVGTYGQADFVFNPG